MSITTSSSPHWLLILNGKSAGDDTLRAAVMDLRADGRAVEVRVTWEPGEAQRNLDEGLAAGVTTIVACGGDGTLSEVAAALARHDASADYLPSVGLVPLVDKGHVAKMQSDLWEHAAKNGDAGILGYLDALNLRTGSINLHHLLETSSSELVQYAIKERTQAFPTWEQSHRTLGPVLFEMARHGDETCHLFLQHLEKRPQPKGLKSCRRQATAEDAWQRAIYNNDAGAAAVLMRAELWPLSFNFADLFHRDLGEKLCQQSPKAMERIAQLMMGLDCETMKDLSMETLDNMVKAGLPVFSWRGEKGETIAHAALEGWEGSGLRQRLAWVLLHDPEILMQPDNTGCLPLDGLKDPERKNLGQLGQAIRSMREARTLQDATPAPSFTSGRSPRF